MDTAARRTRLGSRLACAEAPPRKGLGRRLTTRLGADARRDPSSQVFPIGVGRAILRACRSGRRGMTLGEINGRSNNGRPHWGHRATASRCATASVSTSRSHCQPAGISAMRCNRWREPVTTSTATTASLLAWTRQQAPWSCDLPAVPLPNLHCRVLAEARQLAGRCGPGSALAACSGGRRASGRRRTNRRA
jgi:hypothetical protein